MRVRKDAIVDSAIELDRLPGLAGVGSSVEFDGGLHALPVAQAVSARQLDLGLTRPAVLTRSAMRVKRALDLLGATLGLLALAPLIAVVAAAIKLEGGGAVFYRQLRVGHRGKRFEMLKFRTMVPGADAMKEALRAHNEACGGLFKIAEDPRVTRVGRWLRRSALDELPQLLNILKGEMSLVGPRPLVVEEDERIAGRHRRRLELMPGMTGPWQILGPTRASLNQMVAIDYRYVEHWSLWKDLKILLRTVPHVVGRRGL
ncbi:MAG TPA: sugar transferase [Solirubrobacteraceae bacterium]|jgi:lipopolysaccharide/colanic/teichoic acid biosynthesis glycosyltransferase|nr:sugar transferase [Solirubrobacteraceae bacterium]